MHILGINFSGHDSAASIIRDGKIIACAAEERFLRLKHTGVFPFKAIEYCLKEAGIQLLDLDHIGFYWNPGNEIVSNYDSRDYVRDNREFLYFLMNQLFTLIPKGEKRIDGIVQEVQFRAKPNPMRIYFCEHHMVTAASCFFVSPFHESAILTIDSYGEETTTMFSYGKGNKIDVIDEIKLPNSVGQLYSTVTQFLGFRTNSGEGKVMGLASYGKLSYYDAFGKIVKLLPRGRFELDLSYFEFFRRTGRKYSDKFIEVFGSPRKGEAEPITDRHADIAASIQKVTGDLMVHFATHLKEVTGSGNLCMAGGVALNSVGNGKIFKPRLFKNICVQPAANDVGTSLGSALYVYHQLHHYPRRFVQTHDYWGPSYTAEEIGKMLEIAKIPYTRYDNIEEVTAHLLVDNKIIGWFQGRMEFGPRALGNRSILANPCHPDMKDILNTWVKHRESFRPFAPSILEEKCGEYFDENYPSPYMLLVYDVLPKKRKVVPAITHVDNTGRVQTVNQEQNPRYYRLIKEFEKITGVPVILNTSFNIRGEPIVCTPQDALKCFIATGMDYLVMDNFLIAKEALPGYESKVQQTNEILNQARV